jgi:dTDP-glucose 4,6-dehydratase
MNRGRLGETYNIGGRDERRNIEVVQAICDLLDELRPDPAIGPRRALIAFVADRPGHDLRYAIDASKMQRELGWRPTEAFATGLRRTVEWYLEHQDWCERVQGRAGPWERQGGPIAARLRRMGDDADGPETTLDPADGLTPTATGPTRPF